MKESTIIRLDRSCSLPCAAATVAVEETVRLYHAWLGYLLAKQGDDVLRVKAEEIREALERFVCSATREGDEYVIRLQAGEESENG